MDSFMVVSVFVRGGALMYFLVIHVF